MIPMSLALFASRAIRALVVLALLVPASGAPSRSRATDTVRADRAHDLDVARLVIRGETRPASKLALARATEPDASGYDVQKYTIRYTLEVAKHAIKGETTVDGVATIDGLAKVDLDFVGLHISDVRV